ncbi:hypothetical protein GCM10020001_031580 [Nonomuraea salmonea]
MKVAFLAGHLAGKTTFSPEQHPRRLDAGGAEIWFPASSKFFSERFLTPPPPAVTPAACTLETSRGAVTRFLEPATCEKD